MTMLTALVAAEERTPRELPIPPWLVGVIAILAFAFLLGVTWSFRGTHHKYARPSHGDGTRAGSEAGHTRDVHATDESHWPEHPGHH